MGTKYLKSAGVNRYNKGHIPGAIHLDTNKIEEEPLWNRVSDEDIEKMLLELYRNSNIF